MTSETSDPVKAAIAKAQAAAASLDAHLTRVEQGAGISTSNNIERVLRDTDPMPAKTAGPGATFH